MMDCTNNFRSPAKSAAKAFSPDKSGVFEPPTASVTPVRLQAKMLDTTNAAFHFTSSGAVLLAAKISAS
jgi:hypothetical protein